MSVCLCLSSLALRPPASTCSSLFDYSKKDLPKAPNEEDINKRRLGAKVLCTNGLPHEA